MNLRNRFYKPALIGLAVLLLCGVSRTQQWLNNDRQRLGFTKLTPLENAPPVLAFTTVALGGFRGLIANILWIRASDLQEQDKFFEFVQLSDWITKLEPHFSQVWSHQAWNMAWNISVKFKEPAERWRWVQRGINLLRNEGLKYNPDDAIMYNSLSWIFQMKLGQSLDDAHQYYKRWWASEMQELFGGKANFSELLDPKTPEAVQRVKILKDKYKMDPDLMQQVDKLYGPLEWRLPDAHAIYWAELGRRKSKPKDQDTLRRSIYQSMQQAFHGGGLTESKFTNTTEKTFIIGPNLDLIPTVSATYEKMKSEDENLNEHVGKAHRNFLKDAIYLLYVDGRIKQAQQWLDYVKTNYPQAIPATQDLDNYVLPEVSEILTENDRPKNTTIIEGFLRTWILNLAFGEDEKAATYYSMAKRVYQAYQARLPAGAEERIRLDPLPELQRIVLTEMLDRMEPQYAAVVRTKLSMAAPTNSVSPPAVSPK